MRSSFHDKIAAAFQKQGYRSLSSFYGQHSFTFSYEYLRQIFAGERIPSMSKTDELAKALEIRSEGVRKLAAEARLAQKIRKHYRIPGSTHARDLTEKIRPYRQEIKEDAKILRTFRKLGEKEKEEFLDYLRFLAERWRRRSKKAR